MPEKLLTLFFIVSFFSVGERLFNTTERLFLYAEDFGKEEADTTLDSDLLQRGVEYTPYPHNQPRNFPGEVPEELEVKDKVSPLTPSPPPSSQSHEPEDQGPTKRGESSADSEGDRAGYESPGPKNQVSFLIVGAPVASFTLGTKMPLEKKNLLILSQITKFFQQKGKMKKELKDVFLVENPEDPPLEDLEKFSRWINRFEFSSISGLY